MELIIVFMSLIFFSSFFFFVGVLSSKMEKNFEKNAIQVKATIIEYNSREGRGEYPRVRFISDDKYVDVWCVNTLISNSEYPVGSEITIKYIRRKVLNSYGYEVRMVSDSHRPMRYSTLSSIMKVLGILFLISSIIVLYMYLTN